MGLTGGEVDETRTPEPEEQADKAAEQTKEEQQRSRDQAIRRKPEMLRQKSCTLTCEFLDDFYSLSTVMFVCGPQPVTRRRLFKVKWTVNTCLNKYLSILVQFSL